jgi:NAD(P)-dependent dehydrogenase (short-subunit alcohol dehydrogenase family)
VDSFPADLWDQVYAVNVRAQFFGVKHAVPHLKRAGKGSIVNMSSLAGKHGGPGRAAYSSAKAAVIGMGNSLASELAPFGIRVNTLCPGWIDTPFNRPAIDFIGGDGAVDDMVRATVPMGRQGTPDEVAPIYVYLLSEESSYVTSQALIIDGGSYS